MMELYIHLPFCARKCRYCDFLSWAGLEDRIPACVDALIREMAARSGELGQPALETVFLGGGTPSLVPPEELSRLLAAVRRLFPVAENAEITSEANPGTLTAEWLAAAVSGGVNRLSLGMQAAQSALLRTLGRIHSPAQVAESVHMARAAGIDNLNLDLMLGLPGQTEADWRETLAAALALAPRHLSCYGLIPEEGTPLKDDLDAGRLTLPPEETERAMYWEAVRTLSEHGFEQYEISNFALPGSACRHNIGYWRQVPYIGVGVGAASMLPDPSGASAYLRERNPETFEGWLAMTGGAGQREREPVSRGDARFETMMLGLRMNEGVSEAAFMAMHGVTLEACYGTKLRQLAAQGLVRHGAGRWMLTPRGMDIQNMVLVELMN